MTYFIKLYMMHHFAGKFIEDLPIIYILTICIVQHTTEKIYVY